MRTANFFGNRIRLGIGKVGYDERLKFGVIVQIWHFYFNVLVEHRKVGTAGSVKKAHMFGTVLFVSFHEPILEGKNWK